MSKNKRQIRLHRKLTAKNPPAPFPASTTIWNPSNGFSDINNSIKLANRSKRLRKQPIKGKDEVLVAW